MLFRLSFIILALLGNHFGGRSVKDDCEIKGPGFHGYIMPLDTRFIFDGKDFVPSRAEAYNAERIFHKHLGKFCRSYQALVMSPIEKIRNGIVWKNRFKHYFRQYRAFVNEKDHHRIIYILCVSPRFRDPEDLKKETPTVNDGGSIMFHAYIDLDSGNVYITDNGHA